MRLQCHYLDRQNPFLKLGPFMYEPLNDIPHVGIIRQFAFPEEMNAMKRQVGTSVDILLYSLDRNFILKKIYRVSRA